MGPLTDRTVILCVSDLSFNLFRSASRLTLPAVAWTFNAEPILLPRSRDVPLLPTDALGSDQFVPLYLEWESRDDQSLQEK